MIHFNKGKTLLCGLLALLFGGCADQEALPTEGADGTACTLNIAVEGSSTLNSRTPVVDPSTMVWANSTLPAYNCTSTNRPKMATFSVWPTRPFPGNMWRVP